MTCHCIWHFELRKASCLDPVVVLRSNDICFLGILRSCAKAGIPTIPVVFDWAGSECWHSEKSRYFEDAEVIDNPFESPGKAVQQLEAIGERIASEIGKPPIIIPSSDTNLMLLLNSEERLGRCFRMMGANDFSSFPQKVADKAACMHHLMQQGVPVPVTRLCVDSRDIDSVVGTSRYPCIYKPAVKDYGQSFYRQHNGLKAIECDTPENLRAGLTKDVGRGHRLIVQEKVLFAGPHEEIPFYLYADRRGKIRIAATAIKRKIQPHPFGTANVLELAWHPELLEHAQRVVDAFQYRGILMIEFIRDQKDGVWKVIELNPRPWLFIDFFRRFGVNFLAGLKYDTGDDWAGESELLVPSADILAKTPLHLALSPLLCGQQGDTVALEQLYRDYQGSRTVTFFDPEDTEPGMSEVGSIARRLKIDPEGFGKQMVSGLSGR